MCAAVLIAEGKWLDIKFLLQKNNNTENLGYHTRAVILYLSFVKQMPLKLGRRANRFQ